MAMSERRAEPYVFALIIIAINFISFTHYIYAQQCHMAHDKNALKTLQERANTGDADAQCGLGKQYEYGRTGLAVVPVVRTVFVDS
jgi:TPR repeat protein